MLKVADIPCQNERTSEQITYYYYCFVISIIIMLTDYSFRTLAVSCYG